MSEQDAKRHTPVENPPPEPLVCSQEEQVERTGRAPEVTGQTEDLPKDAGHARGSRAVGAGHGRP